VAEGIKEAPPADGLERYSKFLRIEVTLVIAAMLGAFTLNGYVHLETYYAVLDLPIDRLNFSAQKLVAYGGAGISAFITAILFALALVATFSVLLALCEKPGKKPVSPIALPKWANRVRRRANELNLPFKIVAALCVVTAFAFLAWELTVSQPSKTGRKAALRTAKTCDERTLVYSNLERYRACQVAESDDMLYLLKRGETSKSGIWFRTFQVPKAGLVKSEGQDTFVAFDPSDEPETN